MYKKCRYSNESVLYNDVILQVCLVRGRHCSKSGINVVLFGLLDTFASKSSETFIAVHCTKLRLVSENMHIHQQRSNNLKTRKTTFILRIYESKNFKAIRMQLFWMSIAVGTNTYNCYLSIPVPCKVLTQIRLQPYLRVFFHSRWKWKISCELRKRKQRHDTRREVSLHLVVLCVGGGGGGWGLNPISSHCLVLGFSRSHSLATPQSVGLLWRNDRPEAETFAWRHTTLKEKTVHTIGGIRTHNQQAGGHRPTP